MDGDDATGPGAGLIVGTVVRVAKQGVGVALVEAPPKGDLLTDRGIAPRVEPARPATIFQPVRKCRDRSQQIRRARDGLGLPEQFRWIIAVQVERAANQGLRKFAEYLGIVLTLEPGRIRGQKIDQ